MEGSGSKSTRKLDAGRCATEPAPTHLSNQARARCRSCGEKENLIVTKVVIPRNGIGHQSNVNQRLPEEKWKHKW